MSKELFKIDKNGTKYFREEVPCYRCGGHGIYYTGVCNGQLVPAHPDAGVCYRCGGSGKELEVTKEYTPEYEAKLAARRQKKQEKEAAKRKELADAANAKFFKKYGFNSEGFMWIILGNTFEIKDDLKALGCKYENCLGWHCDHDLEGYSTLKIHCSDIYYVNVYGEYFSWMKDPDDDVWKRIEKANNDLKGSESNTNQISQFVGQVGDKIEVKCTLTKISSYKTTFNFHTVYTDICIFKDESGNVYVWKTTSWFEACVDDQVILKGTVKEHAEYKGVKQTVLTRCKVIKERM